MRSKYLGHAAPTELPAATAGQRAGAGVPLAWPVGTCGGTLRKGGESEPSREHGTAEGFGKEGRRVAESNEIVNTVRNQKAPQENKLVVVLAAGCVGCVCGWL